MSAFINTSILLFILPSVIAMLHALITGSTAFNFSAVLLSGTCAVIGMSVVCFILHAKENHMTIFRNYYACDTCGEEWFNIWNATCDDRCPRCRCSMTPYHSDDVPQSTK